MNNIGCFLPKTAISESSLHNDERGIRSVEALRDLHVEGNIVPMEWFAHLKLSNGKPDVNAILILSDILYWYRPTQVRDEETGMVIEYRKKFKGDILQKSYSHYVNLFGFGKYQVVDAITRLEERGLIERVWRTIETPSVTLNNVLFIVLNVERVKQLQVRVTSSSYPQKNEEITSQPDTLSDLNPIGSLDRTLEGPWIEPDTYTKTTTEITTERETRARANERFSQNAPLSEEEKLPKEKKERGTSLDINWVLPDAWREWSIQCGMMNEEIDRIEEKFRNYWRSTVKNAVKKDWFATWKNWCISEYERKGQPLNLKNATPRVSERQHLPNKVKEPIATKKTSSNPKMQLWYDLQPRLRNLVGEANYESWIERHLELVQIDEKAVFKASSNFTRDWIYAKFRGEIAAVLVDIDPRLGIEANVKYIL